MGRFSLTNLWQCHDARDVADGHRLRTLQADSAKILAGNLNIFENIDFQNMPLPYRISERKKKNCEDERYISRKNPL